VKGIELIVTVDNADKTRFDNSMLFPVFADTDLSNDEGNYILVGDEFKRASSLSNAVAKAGTAYLYDPAGSVAVITLTLNGSEDTPDTPTSINERSLDDEDGEWYSINGQRINKPTRKGIYIKNGKKVTVK
jgi:hypothetical protein